MDALPDPPPSRLAEMAARRFPLVARSQVISRPLITRISQIEARAAQAQQRGPDSLLRAAEALNLAALLASDCGDADLARTLCRQQFDLFHAARPHPAATTQLALQPVINLARLHTRAGDGTTAFALLHQLFAAVTSNTTIDIDGHTADLSDLTRSDDDHRQIGIWLWEILISDGMRALARASQWESARTHAEQLRGIGRQLGDGRQIAVLAHIFNDRPADALGLLHDSDLADPWEQTVAACLTILCQRVFGRPANDATTQMIACYLELHHDLTLVTVLGRLGLAVIDLLHSDPDDHTAQILQRLADVAAAPGGGYAARDLLQHPASTRLSAAQRDELTQTARTAGLGIGSVPDELLTRLLTAVKISKAALNSTFHDGRRAIA
ncbi:hypothetical protein [Actinoallomurus sp. CA-150999]|uniref:hypothetical protein n=1 Tax=Actinoallomurus sp. CA-150999 TaxID=3239887 RepID=UPI003D913AE1